MDIETNDPVVRECIELIDELAMMAGRVEGKDDSRARGALAEFLEGVRPLRRTKFFQMNISDEQTYSIDCALPHNTHPLKWPFKKCRYDSDHVFCWKHRLKHCPQCGGPLK